MVQRKTPLIHAHEEMGAEIGDFAGWLTSIRFSSVKQEHASVRGSVGLFDISHMTRTLVEGNQALDFLQKTITVDVSRMKDMRMKYCLICNYDGGIKDDATVFKFNSDRYLVVTNAVTREKIGRWFEENSKDMDVEIKDVTDEIAMLAIQGPTSSKIMSKYFRINFSAMKWFSGITLKIEGKELLVTRSGYTGEDGFEIFIKYDEVSFLEKVWREIVGMGARPCGLATRDTLRLECSYPLYDNDMDEGVTPVEARLMHSVDTSKPNFNGKSRIIEREKEGPKKVLVGIEMEDKGIPRKGYGIHDKDGNKIGEVTSGSLSFSLGKGIALGYVKPSYLSEGTKVFISIHGDRRMGRVRLGSFIDMRIPR